MWSSLGPETHSFFQPDFLVNIILLIGRDVKGNLCPYGRFLWKIGLVLIRDSLVVSYGIWGSSVCASGWRGGCASRMKNRESWIRWNGHLDSPACFFGARMCAAFPDDLNPISGRAVPIGKGPARYLFLNPLRLLNFEPVGSFRRHFPSAERP